MAEFLLTQSLSLSHGSRLYSEANRLAFCFAHPPPHSRGPRLQRLKSGRCPGAGGAPSHRAAPRCLPAAGGSSRDSGREGGVLGEELRKRSWPRGLFPPSPFQKGCAQVILLPEVKQVDSGCCQGTGLAQAMPYTSRGVVLWPPMPGFAFRCPRMGALSCSVHQEEKGMTEDEMVGWHH